jgi:predicted secreted protein
VIDKNPLPFSSQLRLSGAEPFISADVRMRETSEVRCFVRSDGKLYVKRQLVRVAVSGFGG